MDVTLFHVASGRRVMKRCLSTTFISPWESSQSAFLTNKSPLYFEEPFTMQNTLSVPVGEKKITNKISGISQLFLLTWVLVSWFELSPEIKTPVTSHSFMLYVNFIALYSYCMSTTVSPKIHLEKTKETKFTLKLNGTRGIVIIRKVEIPRIMH